MMTPGTMTRRNDNLLAAANGIQTPSFWSPLPASRLAGEFGTGATGCFVPSPAYQPGQSIAKNYPAPPIASACYWERWP
jgi:hypothetical protein